MIVLLSLVMAASAQTDDAREIRQTLDHCVASSAPHDGPTLLKCFSAAAERLEAPLRAVFTEESSFQAWNEELLRDCTAEGQQHGPLQIQRHVYGLSCYCRRVLRKLIAE